MLRRPVGSPSFRRMLYIAGVFVVSLLAIAARPAPKQSGALPRERYLSPIEMEFLIRRQLSLRRLPG